MSAQPTHLEVPLPCGRRFLIDPTGFDKIKHLSWQSAKNSSQKYYVRHSSVEKGADGSWHVAHLLLARFLTDLEKGDPRVADHINGNSLDNRWVNLRVCTGPQNVCNRKISKNNTSGFKGVSEAKNGRWVATITYKRKTCYLGTFDTPEEAHRAYCEAAIRLHGKFANFGVKVPPPGPGIEVLLPLSIGFLRQHLPDPLRHISVKRSVDGEIRAVPLTAVWSEHRSNSMIGLLESDKLIYDRAFRRFRDLVANDIVSESDRPVVLVLLTASEVGYDSARTLRVSRQKHPAVVQVFKNMLAAGLWREWEPAQGIRWGFEYGWVPEDEADRWKFGIELTSHVAVAREGVAAALAEWSRGIAAARTTVLEVARQEKLARPENQPCPRESSRLRPAEPIRNLVSGQSKLRIRI